MNISSTFIFAVLWCPIALQAQTQSLPNVRFAGCYEVVSQKWHPMNEDASPMPGRFSITQGATRRKKQRDFADAKPSRESQHHGKALVLASKGRIACGFYWVQDLADFAEP